MPDHSPYTAVRGVFCIFLRDLYSVDLYLDPDWRTFWSEQGFAIALFGVGFETGNVDTTTVSYVGQSMRLRDAYLRILTDAGTALHRPELATAPIVWWGHSATSYTVSGMVDYVPQRTVAFVSQHGFDHWGNLGTAARKVPGIVTAGRLDKMARWSDKTDASGTVRHGTRDQIVTAREAGSAYSGGLEIDTPHGSGLYEASRGDRDGSISVNAPLRTDPFHYRHEGNPFVSPHVLPGARSARQLYNFQSRKGFLMPLLAQVIARRMPAGVFSAVSNPLLAIDQKADWLAEPAPQSVQTAPTARGPFGSFDIKSYASASEQERKSWAWFPSQQLARLSQFYFSAGYVGGPTASGANLHALNANAYVGGGTNALGVFELQRPGRDAWRLDPGLGDLYANNHTDTQRWCNVAVQPTSTAVLGKDYVIDRSPFVSQNLAGRRSEGYGGVNQFSPQVPSIPQWYQAPNAVRFFDRTATSYVTVRALDDVHRTADKTVVLALTRCDGLAVGAGATATVVVKPHGVAAP